MRILCPLNTDEWAEASLARAVEIARSTSELHDTMLTFLTVVPTAAQTITITAGIASPGELLARAGAATSVASTAADAATEYLDTIRDRFQSSPGDSSHLTIDLRVEAGPPAETILRIAEEIGADLIALTNRGPKGLRRSTLTSINDRVIRSSGRPVLIVTVNP